MIEKWPWIKGLIPLALFVALGVFLAGGLKRDPSVLPSQMIDRPLPDFRMETLSGKPVGREDLTGEVMLLNVFGSWCVGCLVEHPLLMEISQDQDVKLVGINWRDPRERANAWLSRHGDPYATIISDPDSRLIIALGVAGAPETFVIDATGRIRYKHVGPISPKDWSDTIKPLVDVLRDESAGDVAEPAL